MTNYYDYTTSVVLVTTNKEIKIFNFVAGYDVEKINSGVAFAGKIDICDENPKMKGLTYFDNVKMNVSAFIFIDKGNSTNYYEIWPEKVAFNGKRFFICFNNMKLKEFIDKKIKLNISLTAKWKDWPMYAYTGIPFNRPICAVCGQHPGAPQNGCCSACGESCNLQDGCGSKDCNCYENDD